MKRTIMFNEHIFANDFAEMYETLGYFLGQLSLSAQILNLKFTKHLVDDLDIEGNAKKYLFAVEITIHANWIVEEGVIPYIYISEDSKLTVHGKIESI